MPTWRGARPADGLPLLDAGGPVAQITYAELDIAVKQAIAGGNMARLLGVPRGEVPHGVVAERYHCGGHVFVGARGRAVVVELLDQIVKGISREGQDLNTAAPVDHRLRSAIFLEHTVEVTATKTERTHTGTTGMV